MRIKFLVLMLSLFLGILFFVVTEETHAACCFIKSGTCEDIADGGSNCAGTYSAADCSDISDCAGSGSGGTGTGGSGSSGSGSGSGGATFTNPLQFNSIQEVLDSLLSNLRGIVVTIAIIFIVLGGLLYMTSAGNEKRIGMAKACVTAAVIGIAIVMAAPTFLIEIKRILGDNTTAAPAGSTLAEIATRTLELLLSILGIIAIISMIIGGGMYLTAYGDEKKIDTGKKIIQYSIYGIIVALASLVIIRQVEALITG